MAKSRVSVILLSAALSCFILEAVSQAQWPRGSYGLVRVGYYGCPRGTRWYFGERYHDTENFRNRNRWSPRLHMAGSWGKNMKWQFCMQIRKRTGPRYWPRGTYCIFSKFGCPSGFRRGWLYYDDQNLFNRNKARGVLPDGNYGRNTRYYFCCRRDSSVRYPMTLPTQSPFIMFPYPGSRCQSVKGMRFREEWFHWDCENFRNKNKRWFPYAKETNGGRDMRVHMCYYYR